MSKKLEAIARQMEDLSPSELAQLQTMLVAFMDTENPIPETTEPTEASGVGREGKGGYIEIKNIKDKKSGKVYGPYRYLRWKDDKGRLRSTYLGKGLKTVVGGKADSDDGEIAVEAS